MNRKYLIHFTWIITLIMLIFTVLCVFDHTWLGLPLLLYVFALIIYVLPMTYLKSKEAEIVCIEFENEDGKAKILNKLFTIRQREN